MNEKSCRVSESACRVSKYSEISRDVWNIFKKYLPTSADTISFVDDVQLLTEKYKDNPRIYEFFQKLMKVYFDELNELKGLRDAEKNSRVYSGSMFEVQISHEIRIRSLPEDKHGL